MKKIYCIFYCLCCLESKAQDGVYLNSQDFEKEQLIATNAIVFKERYSSVKVKNGTTKIYNFKNAFGYRKGEKDWRFVGNKSYEILSKKGIYVYRLDISNEMSNQLYYFSKEADGDLIPLSKRNLRKAYADNQDFIELLNEINWQISLEEAIPPFNTLRIAELYNYTIAKK